MAPYLAGEKEWTWENIDDGITVMAIPLMRRAATVYGSPELSSASRRLSAQRPLTEWMAWLTSV
ncbi:hypothetical protein [Paenibacillus ginsengarvi]|uniref:hypothetical protein n=1 Tax=Paenibacillus ginsengarvi TaxID=400777 RepID=UPI001457349A|nr:hypothetical protein [Paenibacillus ginsengarvi]